MLVVGAGGCRFVVVVSFSLLLLLWFFFSLLLLLSSLLILLSILTNFRPDFRHALHIKHVSLEGVGQRSPAEDVGGGAAAAGASPPTVARRRRGAAGQRRRRPPMVGVRMVIRVGDRPTMMMSGIRLRGELIRGGNCKSDMYGFFIASFDL